MAKLTVIMLNWKRPQNVARFIPDYLRMAEVADAIVFDCALTPLPSELKDSALVIRCQSPQDPGLVARFAAAALSRTEAILFVDDDIELPPSTVSKLYGSWLINPNKVAGLFGRRPSAVGVYSSENVYGDCPIVLTRAMVLSRTLAVRAAPVVHRMVEECGGVPYGNGEDIVLSCLATSLSDCPNLAVKLPFDNVGYDDAHAISVRYPQHIEHRTRVVQWCQRRLFPF